MILNIKSENEHQRIDIYLSENLDISRSHIKKLIIENKVTVNNENTKPNYKLKTGDEIYIEDLTPEVIDINAQNIPLNIAFEDEYLLVVDKPSGMVVHPAPGNYENTLVNAVMYHSKELSNIGGEFRPGIVHRIDKDTSGLLLIAKSNDVHNKLAEMIKNKDVKRKYKAIVHGAVREKEAKIIAPIGRDANDRKKMTVTDKNSKEAITYVKLIANNDKYSLVECELETGRTHQIRVHLKYINHPVLGDPKYGPRKTIDTKGQALHAFELEFIHPITKEHIKLNSPLPKEFISSLQVVGLEDK